VWSTLHRKFLWSTTHKTSIDKCVWFIFCKTQQKTLKIFRKIWTPRCFYELDLDVFAIYLCQLARQHDLTQNNPLETLFLSSLCCRSDSEEVPMNLIQLTCQSKYVSWQASWIKYKITSSNTFPEDPSLILLCCFKLFNYFCTFFFI
jgi:hypothetical protein